MKHTWTYMQAGERSVELFRSNKRVGELQFRPPDITNDDMDALIFIIDACNAKEEKDADAKAKGIQAVRQIG